MLMKEESTNVATLSVSVNWLAVKIASEMT